MNLLASLKRPEYLFRPAQIFRRVRCELRGPASGYETIRLPWGLPIRVETNETQGSNIRRLGVCDLHVCEFISRLLDPGELAIDVGANIGQMTSLMALRVGPSGRVLSFEPHPVVFGELLYNVELWKRQPGVAPIELHRLALSDHEGVAQLVIPSDFKENHMLAFLSDDPGSDSVREHFEVSIRTLDSLVEAGKGVALLKIDVEGHELKVLQGAKRLLSSGSVRDILFEEHRIPPTPVTELLESRGYSLHRVGGGVRGPAIRSSSAPHTSSLVGPPNLIATQDPARLASRMSGHGWAALRNQGRHEHAVA